jgi:guanylate kinase
MTTFQEWVVTPPILLVLSGPSGVGKTSLCDRLVSDLPDAVYSISVTTRPKRPGEAQGEEYFFASEREFQDLCERGQLLEWANVHGHQYGTPRHFVEAELAKSKVVVLNIDVQGGLQVMSSYPDGVFVFLMPPSLEELTDRIRGRGEDADDVIALRMQNMRGEITKANEYGYIVMNDDFERCLATLKSIIVAERSLRRRCYKPQPLERPARP